MYLLSRLSLIACQLMLKHLGEGMETEEFSVLLVDSLKCFKKSTRFKPFNNISTTLPYKRVSFKRSSFQIGSTSALRAMLFWLTWPAAINPLLVLNEKDIV